MKTDLGLDVGRRQALKLAASAGIAYAAPTIARASSQSAETRAYDVVVVGAGVAGLYAARELLNNGYQVLVLEASDRHGGRMYSKTLGGTRIEMGAEEHYLATNNPIYNAVVGELGADAYVPAYPGDTLISMNGGETCWEETGRCEQDRDIRNYWKYWSQYGNRAKHQDFSITMADDVLAQYGVSKGHRAYHLFDSGIAGSIYGASLERIGAASLAQQDWIWTLSSDVRMLTPHDIGYLDILNRLWWDNIIKHVDLNKPVTEIDSTGKSVVITDAAGNQYLAHKVIVTASIGVLQSETIRFSPRLPASTIDAYNNIGMGRGMKVALQFSEQFWESKMAYLITEGLSSSCWIPSSYKENAADKIVMCYPMGNNGQTLTDIAKAAGGGKAGADAIIKIMLSDLDLIFGGRASVAYIDGIVQDWTAEPYIRGSYSYPMAGTYQSGSSSKRKQLRKSVNDQIFFAGEGTSHTNPACVPGALQEGARAARQVHTLLGGLSRPPSTA